MTRLTQKEIIGALEEDLLGWQNAIKSWDKALENDEAKREEFGYDKSYRIAKALTQTIETLIVK